MAKGSAILSVLSLVMRYRLVRHNIVAKCRPITLTFSVTGRCQSNCKTCHIGKAYRRSPKRITESELRLDEIEKIFLSLGSVYFLNISGGEPFLRNDLCRIIESAIRFLKPAIIHIPTNGFLPWKAAQVTKELLNMIDDYGGGVTLTVKPSVDGIGQKHDEIRGLEGNFERLEETIEKLRPFEREHQNFHLELGTVVSVYNINDMEEIENWVQKKGIQSYRNEIAEQREEFHNLGDEITPSYQIYAETMKIFKEKIQRSLKYKKPFTKMTESMRLVYYDLAVKIMQERRQVIPCYAGISNIHLNYDGDIWPCCVLGHSHSMGNIRDFDYNYDALYISERAKNARAYISKGLCFCPLANQAYSNILMSPLQLTRVIRKYLVRA